MKTRCTLLVENLQPMMQRTQAQGQCPVEFEARMSQFDDRALYRLVVEQQNFSTIREPHAQKKEATVKRGKERDSEAQHKATAQGPRNGCLSCKGLHWVKDCPNLTETQRKEVLDRLQEKKNKASEDRDTHTLHVGHDAGDGSEMQVKQNELQALQPSLQIEQMAEPIVANLADGTPVDCATKLRGDLQLVTSAGTVNVSGVECLVLPTGRDEVLLGD
ncbi:Zinc finger, CCHC-type [Phytophthora cactorum]|nr:Zinc finger, CCHC-type [Phytophthora cactorum]KAF1792629.1 Zinc finger, CCHC-type [Phytophthora cactorum]